MKFEWEQIESDDNSTVENFYSDTFRSKVFGGWIIKNVYLKSEEDINKDSWNDLKLSMVFIPDPEHKWEIE